MQGYTENYIRVSAPFNLKKVGTVEYGIIGKIQSDDCFEFNHIQVTQTA